MLFKNQTKLIPITTVAEDYEGILLCELLIQAGIEAQSLPLGQLLYGTPETNKAWGQIWVLDKDAESAKRVIENYLKAALQDSIKDEVKEKPSGYRPFISNILHNGPDRNKKQDK